MSGTGTTKRSSTAMLDAVIIGLKLLLICAVVAGLVAGIYALTDQAYRANQQELQRKAIAEIFASDSVLPTRLTDEKAAEAVYEVKDGGGQLLGYCVEITGMGYGGEIGMTVGFYADRSIKGVSIVSLNETPGLGAKVKEPAYLAQYEGQSGELTLREDIDAVAGATISSRAVLEAVNNASSLLEQTLLGGAQ